MEELSKESCSLVSYTLFNSIIGLTFIVNLLLSIISSKIIGTSKWLKVYLCVNKYTIGIISHPSLITSHIAPGNLELWHLDFPKLAKLVMSVVQIDWICRVCSPIDSEHFLCYEGTMVMLTWLLKNSSRTQWVGKSCAQRWCHYI